jgi:hypothetical protein
MSDLRSDAHGKDARARPPLPSAKELFFVASLYFEFSFAKTTDSDILSLRDGDFQFDGYCDKCETSSIFKGVNAHTLSGSSRMSFVLSTQYFDVHATCARCGRNYKIELLKASDRVQKVGQYPSMEDIGSADIVKFRKLLQKDDFAELRRATGLFSHGIGIGSFVYLRRIFERMIEAHRLEAVAKGDKIEQFVGKRMDEKIKILSHRLPSILVKNASLYGILSKGIHELDEATCRKHFPVVKSAIIAILEQDLREQEEAATAAALQSEIDQINQAIR